jgi:prepilin-type N-terminal cleavage/methylation domain-containing protein
MWERMIEKRNEGGFTLIELLIVIIILAILAAIVVFAVGTTGQNAASAACSSDAKTFETALEAYKAEMGSFPALGTGSELTTQQVVPGTTTLVGPWMRTLPGTTHYTIWTDGNGGVFVGSAGSATIPETTDSSYNFDTSNPNVCTTGVVSSGS